MYIRQSPYLISQYMYAPELPHGETQKKMPSISFQAVFISNRHSVERVITFHVFSDLWGLYV